MKSTHQATVCEVQQIRPHPNAAVLDIIEHDGYTSCVKRGDFKVGDRFVFIVPDTIVSGNRDEFKFLGEGKHRIKVKKLRGTFSQGLIIPTDKPIGTDLWNELELERYEPEIQMNRGEQVSGPSIMKYDVDSIHKYLRLIKGEVVATEKVHGANARYLYDDKLYCGSRTNWKKEGDNPWWIALTPEMQKFCEDYPKYVLYGEVFGQVQDMKYGRVGSHFIAFDIMRPNYTFVVYDEFTKICDDYNIPRVPEFYRGEFDFEQLKEIAEIPSKLYDGGKEGIVIRGVNEIDHPKYGRLCFKIVSNWYYTRK